jgi:hypothetical protein
VIQPTHPSEASSERAVGPDSRGGRVTTASPAFPSRLTITFQWRARLRPSIV